MSDHSHRARYFGDLLEQRLTRREVLSAAAALTPLAAAPTLLKSADALADADGALRFAAIRGSKADTIELPPGYTYDIVARWGDSLSSATPDLDAAKLAAGVLLEPQAAEHQRGQFGQNCDAIHFFPLDRTGNRGVLCVNNEYTDDTLMFFGHPGFHGALKGKALEYVRRHPQMVQVAQAAHGVSVIEVVRKRGRWSMVKDSRFNRRITANTPVDVGGPARGSALMRTKSDPAGARVLGTFGNCAGGETPWGAYLTAEENIQDYFGNAAALRAQKQADPFVVDAHRRFRMWGEASL